MISILWRGQRRKWEAEFGRFCGKNNGGKGAFRLSQKAGQQTIARGCQFNVASLNKDRPLKNECFTVCDEQVESWPDDARVGFGVRKVWRPRQRLGDWFLFSRILLENFGRIRRGLGLADS